MHFITVPFGMYWAIVCLVIINLKTFVQGCSFGETPEGNEYTCPNILNPEYILKLTELTENITKLKITCQSEESQWNFNLFNITSDFSKVKAVVIEDCPFVSNGIYNLLNILQIVPVYVHISNANAAKLTKEHLNGLHKVKELTLQRNKIKTVDFDAFKDCPNIQRLILDYNFLENIPEALKELQNLESLSLIQNNIKNISNIKNVRKLKHLTLSNNSIKNVSSEDFFFSRSLESLELSNNKIDDLPDDIFVHLYTLKKVGFMGNPIKVLKSYTFRYNPKLEEIVFGNTNETELEENLFKDLTELKTVKLMYFRTSLHLTENIFFGCSSLQELTLKSTKITNLPERLFKDLKNLKNLNLSNNNIKILNASTFADLAKLETLDLSSNSIYEIHVDAFKENNKLKTLNLNANFINKFHDSWFGKKSLEILNLVKNRITELEFTSTINGSSFNLSIDLSKNPIKKISFGDVENLTDTLGHLLDARHSNKKIIEVILNNINLECDCHNLELLRYFRDNLDVGVKSLITLESNTPFNWTCNGLQHHEKNIYDLTYNDLICLENNTELCPRNCECFNRPWDKTLIINCAGKNFEQVPKLNKLTDLYNQTYINLSNNKIAMAPTNEKGYDNVTFMDLSNNILRNISWLPNSLKVLDLRHNKLMNINSNILKQMRNRNITQVYLSDNPWDCTCKTLDFTNFLIHQPVYNKHLITCFNSTKLVVNLEKEEVCKNRLALYLVLSIIFACVLLIFAIMSALYYKYQEEVKVYFFSRKMFLWWIRESDLDKDKPYDAFISYSHFDKEFVEEKLVPTLESGPKPYKLLLHYRDWTPGELITKQIVNSVANSKRTVVVVSPKFLESNWGQMEFKTAHLTAMTEKRPRVIVIIYGNIKEKDMPDEIKSYVNTRTFINWEDSSFWNKLKYNLPHENCFDNISENKINNVMAKIDKMDLVSIPMTPNNYGTTPPIIQDALILKRNPLEFHESDLKITPPAESGIL